MGDIIGWFVDPAHLSGTGSIQQRLLEHVLLSGSAILVATVIGLPIGLYIGSRTPPEIAVSILAEVTAVKNGVALPDVASVAVAKEKHGPDTLVFLMAAIACKSLTRAARPFLA